MSSVIDICNLALSRLGDDATVASIDPPEGSAQAEHCARFYPVARDSLLELHPWKFATRRATLAQLAVDSWDWKYAYAEPSDALKILAVLPTGAQSDDATQPFETESGASGESLILTNQDTAVVRYVFRTTDTTRYSPLFVDALGWLLASHLAGPLLKGDAGANAAKQSLQMFGMVVAQAKISDANQHQADHQHIPDWMKR